MTIQPVAPALLARIFLSGSLSVVSTRIGDDAEALDLARALDEAESVHLGHVDVGDDQVRVLAFEHVQSVQAVHRLHHVEAGARQSEPQHVAHGAGIVDGENLQGHGAMTPFRNVRGSRPSK